MDLIEKRLRRLTQRVEDTDDLITDVGFLALEATVASHRRTKLRRDRLWVHWQAVQNTSHAEGAVAEVGSFRGGSAYFIAAAFREALGHDIPFDAIDTFTGHPADKVSVHDAVPHRKRGRFDQTSYDEVYNSSPASQTSQSTRASSRESPPAFPSASTGWPTRTSTCTSRRGKSSTTTAPG